MDNDYNLENDCLTEDEFKAVEQSQEKILDTLYAKVRDHDEAKAWLNSSLGREFRMYLATDKQRQMKISSTEKDPTKLGAAQFEYAVICKVESLFGSILIGGSEALQQLEVMDKGDTNDN